MTGLTKTNSANAGGNPANAGGNPANAGAKLLASCRALGIDLAAGPDGTLSWEADSDPPGHLLAGLRQHKSQLLLLLRAEAISPRSGLSPLSPAAPDPAARPAEGRRCPGCGGPLDRKARCWKCCDRVCSQCGRATGSAFIELCLRCDGAFQGEEEFTMQDSHGRDLETPRRRRGE
jgi:hypothetical protein